MGFFSSLKEAFNEGLNQSSNTRQAYYLCGHPSIGSSKKIAASLKGEVITLISRDIVDFDKPLGRINGSDIIDIYVEDKSTIEKRVTLGRVLLVGIFALAWQKKKKENHYYVVIEWKEGERFTNETVFEFEGNNAAATAHNFRNFLIKEIS